LKRRSIYRNLLLLFSILLVHQYAFSQAIKAEVDRDKILIGEQIQLKLTIENARTVTSWFNIPDTVNHIEIVERGKIDTLDVNDAVIYQQVITLTSFDSGRWEFPPLSVKGINQSTPPITIDVLPVDVSQLADYHDIKDIEEAEVESSMMITIIIAVVTLLSILLLILLYRIKKRAAIEAPVNIGSQSPYEWAIAELDKLQKEQLYEHGKVKQHYSQLIDITQRFFKMQRRGSPMQLTLDEWIVELQSLQVNSDVKIAFFQLLRMGTSVKFAKYLPSIFDNHQSVQIAKDMIEAVTANTEQLKYQPANS
jgi:hypothetical protein